MTHKDEIFVCPQCKVSFKENMPHRYGTAMHIGEAKITFESGCSGTLIPYLPSSSVKELIEAAKDMLLAFDYLITSDKTWQGKAKRKLETTLKSFEEEK